ncbi:MAG: metallophosphoesterase family protein [Spirochaetia bacterium]|nr:metallophosphoesterase family protein [Spirochaetia bacterium]
MVFFNKKYKWNDGPYLILKGIPETSITICWLTAKNKNSILLWGDIESNLNQTELSIKKRFHSITIDNLSSDSTYFYTIKESFSLYSIVTVFSFRTAKVDNNNLEFIIAGDLQPKNQVTLNTNNIMAQQINKENPNFIIQLGDLVQIGSILKYWHFLMKSLPLMASSRPILPAIGNHEYYLFHRNKTFRMFFPYRFFGGKGSYYSKNIGNLHLTFLDPYDGGFAGMNSKISNKQKKWFVKDLEKAVKDGAGWIFVILHHAVLSNGEYSGDIKLQEWILPIVSKFDVDAVFWGHAHLYEHWQYQYGKNGFVINSDDIIGDNPIDFFCIGSSGASPESNFRLFSHKPFKRKILKWFNLERGVVEKKTTIQYPWNREMFFEGKMGIDQFKKDDHHYFHLPCDKQGNYLDNPGISYNTESKWFGYMYGENTLHYAKVKIKDNNCIISIHYVDGSILKGPDGSLSQEFIFKMKIWSV